MSLLNHSPKRMKDYRLGEIFFSESAYRIIILLVHPFITAFAVCQVYLLIEYTHIRKDGTIGNTR